VIHVCLVTAIDSFSVDEELELNIKLFLTFYFMVSHLKIFFEKKKNKTMISFGI